jgi:hypothetical protein
MHVRRTVSFRVLCNHNQPKLPSVVQMSHVSRLVAFGADSFGPAGTRLLLSRACKQALSVRFSPFIPSSSMTHRYIVQRRSRSYAPRRLFISTMRLFSPTLKPSWIGYDGKKFARHHLFSQCSCVRVQLCYHNIIATVWCPEPAHARNHATRLEPTKRLYPVTSERPRRDH